MRIEATDSPTKKQRWQIIRRDFCGPRNGIVASGEEIIEADDATGRVVTLRHTYGANGHLIVDAAGKPILEPVTTEYGLDAIRLVRR